MPADEVHPRPTDVPAGAVAAARPDRRRGGLGRRRRCPTPCSSPSTCPPTTRTPPTASGSGPPMHRGSTPGSPCRRWPPSPSGWPSTRTCSRRRCATRCSWPRRSAPRRRCSRAGSVLGVGTQLDARGVRLARTRTCGRAASDWTSRSRSCGRCSAGAGSSTTARTTTSTGSAWSPRRRRPFPSTSAATASRRCGGPPAWATAGSGRSASTTKPRSLVERLHGRVGGGRPAIRMASRSRLTPLVPATPDAMAGLAEIGVTDVITVPWYFAGGDPNDPSEQERSIAWFADEVIRPTARCVVSRPRPDETATPAAKDDHPARLASRQSMAAVEAGDREAWLALFAPDALVEDPIGVSMLDPDRARTRRRRGHRRLLRHGHRPEPVAFEIRESYAAGNEVANVGTITTTLRRRGTGPGRRRLHLPGRRRRPDRGPARLLGDGRPALRAAPRRVLGEAPPTARPAPARSVAERLARSRCRSGCARRPWSAVGAAV